MVTGEPEQAVTFYRKNAQIGDRLGARLTDRIRVESLHNLACAYALSGKSDAALDALADAIDDGWHGRKTTRMRSIDRCSWH